MAAVSKHEAAAPSRQRLHGAALALRDAPAALATLSRCRSSGRGRLPRAVAQDEAGAAGAADAAAQRFGGGARVGAHAHLVERLRAAAAQDRAQEARIAPGEL